LPLYVIAGLTGLPAIAFAQWHCSRPCSGLQRSYC
jgi:hypothetical protein